MTIDTFDKNLKLQESKFKGLKWTKLPHATMRMLWSPGPKPASPRDLKQKDLGTLEKEHEHSYSYQCFDVHQEAMAKELGVSLEPPVDVNQGKPLTNASPGTLQANSACGEATNKSTATIPSQVNSSQASATTSSSSSRSVVQGPNRSSQDGGEEQPPRKRRKGDNNEPDESILVKPAERRFGCPFYKRNPKDCPATSCGGPKSSGFSGFSGVLWVSHL
jgi:hypothetical protein